MKKARWIAMVLMLSLCLSMIACNGGNTLLEGAAPKNSALAVYYYDGKDTVRGHIFGESQVKAVLDELAAVNAKPVKAWSAKDITAPMYGISILKEDGRPLSAIWSNGLWITQDGQAYKFDYDFAGLWADKEWQATNIWTDQLSMPCQHAITYSVGDREGDHDGGGVSAWDPTWMTPAEELSAKEGLEIELIEWGDDAVTVKLSNHSGEEWVFGEYYHLEVLLEGTWYRVPTAPGENWAVHDIAYMLPDGGEKEMTYSLVCYGELPAGRYRLVAEAFEEGLAVEVDVKTSRSE